MSSTGTSKKIFLNIKSIIEKDEEDCFDDDIDDYQEEDIDFDDDVEDMLSLAPMYSPPPPKEASPVAKQQIKENNSAKFRSLNILDMLTPIPEDENEEGEAESPDFTSYIETSSKVSKSYRKIPLQKNGKNRGLQSMKKLNNAISLMIPQALVLA